MIGSGLKGSAWQAWPTGKREAEPPSYFFGAWYGVTKLPVDASTHCAAEIIELGVRVHGALLAEGKA